MNKSPKFSPEVRERAVRMVREHREEYPSLWAAVESLAPKIGCVPHTLYEWMRKHEVDSGVRQGTTTADKDRLKELERENRELRKANEILKLASAFFAQAELDRRLKRWPHRVTGDMQRASAILSCAAPEPSETSSSWLTSSVSGMPIGRSMALTRSGCK